MEEIPIEVHELSRAILAHYWTIPNRNGKIMLTIYRNKISKLTYIYGMVSENKYFFNSRP